MGSGSLSLHSSPAVFGKPQGSAVALLLSVLLLGTPASAQTVSGRVVDASDSSAVVGVAIALVDTLGATYHEVLSNSAGEFIIMVEAPGMYLFRASRLGYATIQTPAIEIGDGEVLEVEVWLDVEAVRLEPLTVVVRRRETQRERDLRGYYERAEQYGEPHIGSIQIHTRESLAGWDALSLESLFEDYLRWHPSGLGCNPRLYLDGRLQYGPFLADLRNMSVSNIEGVELYAGGGPEDSRFWDPGGCGVVLVWTRVLPEGGGKLGLLEVLVLGGAAVVLMVLTAGALF